MTTPTPKTYSAEEAEKDLAQKNFWGEYAAHTTFFNPPPPQNPQDIANQNLIYQPRCIFCFVEPRNK